MATIALAAVATSIQGSAAFVAAATAALTTIGAIADNAFLFPAIFGRPDIGTVEGPRLSSLAPQDGSEGAALNYVLGARIRVGGNVIWMADLEEVTVSGGGGGGKGGGGGAQQTRTYEYYASAMVAICEGPIEGIVKVYADGKTFVKEASPGTLDATTEISLSDTIQFTSGLPLSYYGPIQLHKSGSGDTFWTDLGFVGNGDVVISGYSDSDNNGTFEVKNRRVRIDGDESLTLRYRSYPPIVTSSLLESVTITQTINRYPANVDRVEFYAGTASDDIDSMVEAAVGLNETPRFKNIAKMAIERLKLADYGNRLPQFNFVVNRQDPMTVREAIEDIMSRGGFSPSDYDVTGIDNTYEIEGYAIFGSKSIAAILEPIMLVWDLAVYEDNGVLTFYERGDETTISDLRDGDWTARVHGGANDDPVLIEETPTFDLPAEISISYPDIEGRDEIGEARARLIESASDITIAARIPISMSAGQARAVAERRLWRAWSNKRNVQFTLPPRFLNVTEGDIVPVTVGEEEYNVRLTRVSRGANYLISCEGVVEENTDFDYSEDGYSVDPGDGGVDQPGNLLLFIFNCGPLSDDHVSTPGFYWAFALEDSNANFTGGALYRATTSAGTYSLVGNAPEATIIATEDQLASVDNPNIFDEANTLDVEVLNGSLASVSEIDLLNGANRLVLSNGEVIAFQTVADLGNGEFRLSKLLRGLRGTERFVGTHGSDGEIGVLVEASTLQFDAHNLGDIGLTRYFKAISAGQAVADIDEEAFEYAGCTVKPFSVVNIEASRDGSNNVTLTWDRRTRSVFNVLTSTIPVPLVDGVEEYEIDLYDPTGSDVESTYSVTSPTATISDTDIVAAGYSSGDPIIVKVYQISPSVGRGIEQEATV